MALPHRGDVDTDTVMDERTTARQSTVHPEVERLRRALRLAGATAWHWRPGDDRMTVSPGFGAMLGVAGEAEDWSMESFLGRVLERDRHKLAELLADALERERSGSARVGIERDDEIREIEIRVEPDAGCVLGTVRDVTDELRDRERARLAGAVDGLTGLPNRRQFQATLREQLALARRSERGLAVLHVELDDFPRIVGAFGSATADDLLRRVSERIRSVLRASDVVGRGPRRLARVGGSGFLAALADLGDRFEPSVAAERLLGQLRRPYAVGDAEIAVTPSLGLATMPEAGHEALDLLRHAEVALAHARRLGGDRMEVFREGLDREAEMRLQLATELHRGIRAGELELVYQPVFDPTDRSCQGVEALVRWRHPGRGLLAPREFLDVAEDTGLIVPLGEWVLDEACAQWRQWLQKGLGPIEVAVNLSGRQLRDPELVARVHRALARAEMDPVFLRLEVPEDVLTPSGESARRALGRLRRLGVGLTLDDFGTRASSLARLSEIDVDLIKIGRSFVEPVPDDQEHASLVAGIVALAHKLRFRVVAEGVENEQQLRYLRAIDCEGVQGFLLGEPAPAASLERLLAARLAAEGAGKVIPFRRRAAS